MHPNDLEDATGRALKRLPSPRAPRTLLTRVMLAVEQAQAPWYARPWLAWPLGWQLVSAVAVLSVVAVASVAIGAGTQWLTPDMVPGARATETWLASALGSGALFMRGVAALWRSVVAPLALIALVPVLMMFTATLIFGAALGRLAFGGPSHT